MHREAICEAFHPAQAGSIAPGRCVTPSRCVAIDAGRVSRPFTVYALFTVYASADFQEVPARSADIRLLRRALWASAGSRTNKASAGTRTNKEQCKQCRNKKKAPRNLP